MFDPYNPAPQGASRPLPPRPMPAWQQKIQEQSALVAAQEEAAAKAAQPLEQPVAVPQFNPPEEKSMSNDTISNPFDTTGAPAFNPNDVIAKQPMAALAPLPEAEPADEATDDDLPPKAGIIDYRKGEGLPTTLSEQQVTELAAKLDGLAISSTFPVEHKEPAIGKDGKQRASKAGKLMMKKVKVPTNVHMLVAGEQNLGWALDPDYAVRLVAEQMIWKVQGHMAAQGVSIREGYMFDSEWLAKHFGAANLTDAIEAELRPWAATKVSTLSAATQSAMCSSVTDADEIIQIYTAAELAANTYLTKLLKGKGTKADIASQLAPIVKARAKYEQWQKRAEKAELEGKPAPKALAIKSLTAETVRGIRAVAGMLLTADTKRQQMAEKFKTGNYPPRFSAEEVAEYVDGTQEYSITMQTVACWLQQIATNMQASEQRKMQKYAADAVAGDQADDFDLI